MVKQFLQYAKGHVRIRVTGSSYERFLNICAKHQIFLWDLQSVDNAYEMNLSIRDFRMLRPLARKSSTKVRIIERYGLPFFFAHTQEPENAFLRNASESDSDDCSLRLYLGYPH